MGNDPISLLKNGCLLVSEPYGDDPYFRRAVVLITEYREDGAVGFILNKCLAMNLSDLVENFPETEYSLCLGGPVSPSTLHYVHTLGDVLLPGAVHITRDLYWGGEFSNLKQLISAGLVPQESIKFFLGYSGWSRGQLQDEIARGGWGVVPYDGRELFSPCRTLWYEVVEASGDYSPWALVPEDPEDN